MRSSPGNSCIAVGFRLCKRSTVEEMRGNLVGSGLLPMVVMWAIRVNPGDGMLAELVDLLVGGSLA